MNHPEFFGPSFAGDSWNTWKTAIKAGEGLPLNAHETEFFKSIAGGREPPTKRAREQWWVIGRRGGKDSVASVVAAYTAANFNNPEMLRPGERALVLCLAVDREQANIVLGMIRAYFETIPKLRAKLIGEMRREGFSLNNNVDIAVGTNSFRTVRGRPLLLVILDEVAYWRDENSARPDEELYRAIKPGLLTLSPLSRIIAISSPYRKSGLLYKKYVEHFGKDDPELVIQAASRVMNPRLPQEEIEAEYAKDFASASAEYGALFRDDVGGWLPLEVIENAVDVGILVRPPYAPWTYRAFVDPSGGRSDSFTCAIAHDQDGLGVLDCVVEIPPPFSPMSAVAQIAATLRQYGLSEVTGDHYAAAFNVEMFAAAGITYRASTRNRSEIYADLLPLLNSGRVRLLDNRKLVSQFAGLERKASPGGRETINHAPGSHDDVCNAAAGALVSASATDRRPRLFFG